MVKKGLIPDYKLITYVTQNPIFRAMPADVRKRLRLSAIGFRLVFEAAPRFTPWK